MTHHTQSQTEKDAMDKAQEAKNKAEDATKDVAHQAKEQTKELASQAKDQARNTLEQRKSSMASELGSVAQAFRSTSQNLRQQNKDSVAQYSNKLADEVERASRYLQEKDVDTLLHDVEDMARRKPELFVGGAFAVGLLAARFFKSSSQHQYDTGRSYGGYGREYASDYESEYGSQYGRQYARQTPVRSHEALPERDYGDRDLGSGTETGRTTGMDETYGTDGSDG